MLQLWAVEASPITQFFLGVATGMIEGEVMLCPFSDNSLAFPFTYNRSPSPAASSPRLQGDLTAALVAGGRVHFL